MKGIKDVINIRNNLVAAKPVPLSIHVNITGRCNLKCEFCEKGRSSSNDEIDIQQLRKLIDFGLKNNCKIVFGGGEPFLHKKIWDILQYCRDAGLSISVLTNGTLFDALSKEQYELLADTINVMSLSLDSTVPLEHDNIRGVKGTYDRALRFLQNPLRKNKVGINSVITPDLKNIQSMIEFAKDVRCSVNFLPLIFESNFPDLDRLEWKKDIQSKLSFSAERMAKLRSLYKYAEKSEVVTNLPLVMKFIGEYFQYANTDRYFFDYVLNKFLCFIPFQQLTVNEKGQITPCTFLPGEGSIYDGDIYENWLKIALKYREILKNGKRFSVCKSCSCHFADNCVSSMIAFPFANRNHLMWMLSYYSKRMLKGGARK